jgi:hypothetical protein
MRATLRRIAYETRRHLARSATLKLATATAVVATVLAWLQGGGLEAPVYFTYYLLPMLASPYAAYLVTKDRRQATTQVLEASPTIRSERLLAQATATIAAPALAIVATTPVLYGLAPPSAPGAFTALLPHLAWALAIAAAAAATGLLLAHLTPRRPRLGLALAFGVPPLWFLLGGLYNSTGAPGPIVAFLGKFSPFTYVEYMWVSVPVPTGPPALLMGPLAISALSLSLMIPISLWLQDEGGWIQPLSRRAGAVGLTVGILAAGALGLGLWPIPEDTTTDESPPQPVETTQAGLYWSVSAREVGFPPPAWSDGLPIEAHITVLGPPNATVELTNIQLEAETLHLEPRGPTDRTIHLNEVGPDRHKKWNESGGPAGRASLTLSYTAHPQELFALTPAELSLQADGNPASFDLSFSAHEWETDTTRTTVVSSATVAALVLATRRLPARWNRW